MDLHEIYKNLKLEILPDANKLEEIFRQFSEIIIQEPNVFEINGPLYIVGDIHGQYYDFLNLIDLFGCPSTTRYLFLGDYVDRGYNSVELFISVMILKILYKKNVFLLRGNHESKTAATQYTFKEECRIKYDDSIFLQFCEIFTFLPVCAIVNSSIFCIHGGLIPNLSLEELSKQDRFEEKPVFFHVYWSDPDDSIETYQESSRGAGFLFSKQDTLNFLQAHNLDCVIRSHQLVETGFESKFNGKVLTVWSAPNYVYTYGNAAAVLHIEKTNITPKYFDKAKPQFSENAFSEM